MLVAGFLGTDSVGEVVDFMVPRHPGDPLVHPGHLLVRRLRAVRGRRQELGLPLHPGSAIRHSPCTRRCGSASPTRRPACQEAAADRGLQVLYAIDGNPEVPESVLDHLDGYKGSRPVRVGNSAAGQLQLDIYGELMDSVYLYNKYGQTIGYDLWDALGRQLDWLEKHWQLPDAGIWESRGSRALQTRSV